nr:ATP-binding protein [Bradyrhizobium ivorense]
MPRALEILDVTLRGIERDETTAVEALDILLAEELTLRENRRVRMALQMARLSAVKTLAGFDFSFQPSLDRNRIMALAELQFIDRAEAVHLIGPLGTGETHLSLALGVEAVKAGRSVYFDSLADIVATLARAEREGALREKISLSNLRPYLRPCVDEDGRRKTEMSIPPAADPHTPQTGEFYFGASGEN